MSLELSAGAGPRRRLDYDIDAQLAPGNVPGLLSREHGDLSTVDVEVPLLDAELVGEGAEDGVESQQILQRSVIRDVADRGDADVVAAIEDAKEIAADAAETCETDSHGCHRLTS